MIGNICYVTLYRCGHHDITQAKNCREPD